MPGLKTPARRHLTRVLAALYSHLERVADNLCSPGPPLVIDLLEARVALLNALHTLAGLDLGEQAELQRTNHTPGPKP